MKKIIAFSLWIILCIAPLSVFAQNLANEAVDAGSGEFNIGTLAAVEFYYWGLYGEDTETHLAIGSDIFKTNFSYFIIDCLSLGGTVGFISDTSPGDEESSLLFEVGPTIRYYFPVLNRFLINITGEFQYMSHKPTIGGFRVDDAINQVALGGALEAGYLIHPNIAINIGIRFIQFFQARSAGESVDETNYRYSAIRLGVRIFMDIKGRK